MKAVRIHDEGRPQKRVFDMDAPVSVVGAADGLVETAATSVDPIDVKTRRGARLKAFPLKLPAILGRDVSGIVRDVGGSKVVRVAH